MRVLRQLLSAVLIWGVSASFIILFQQLLVSHAFTTPVSKPYYPLWSSHYQTRTSRIFSVSPNIPTSEDKVASFRAEADRIRKEAESLERKLYQDKVSNIKGKLANQKWLSKNPALKDQLEAELAMLQQKLSGTYQTTSVAEPSKTLVAKAKAAVENDLKRQRETSSSSSIQLPTTKTGTGPKKNTEQRVPETPFRGFDEEDLEVYIPVAEKIELALSNATIQERLAAFQKAPELQQYFREKIEKMLVKPMEDMKKLDKLRNDYLKSMSKVEKTNIKREIDRLEKQIQEEGPVAYADSVFLNIAPMSDEELGDRVKAVSELPSLLQLMFKQRLGLKDGADLSLAILLDRYEEQLQLLEQIFQDEEYSNDAEEPVKALESLPVPVRDHFASKYDLKDGSDIPLLMSKLLEENESPELKSMQNLVISMGVSDDEYNNIDFIDRSRYAEEFYPALARMEDALPSDEDMDSFLSEVVDSKAFMVRSRPERVVGGYYIRGDNTLSDDESGAKLVARLSTRLDASSLKGKVEFFFMNDPEPLSEEDFEMEYQSDTILYVTGFDREAMCNNADSLTKAGINIAGLASVALFSILSASGNLPTESFTSESLLLKALPVGGFLLAPQVAHEFGHLMASATHNMTIGIPSLIPSVAMGLSGAITPLKSPPPSLKALFDFAVAGPFLGYLVSAFLLLYGLVETSGANVNAAQSLPQLPISFLRSSALGGGLIEAVLGNGALMMGVDLPPEAMLPLHPAAIGGFVGLITNALALLPFGNTDGGRIALAMFGRRVVYLASTAIGVLLCALGLFGLDASFTLLTYTLFAVLWQRELELPALNEVEELDIYRGGVGVVAAFLVALTILPF